MIGKTLGHYEILEKIGAGGMGEVYRARDPRLDRVVAIKVLPSHLSQSPQLKQRFEREARAISRLSHPHICTLHDVGSDHGIDYLVMEHLEGESLAHSLARGPLPLEELLRVATQIADALDKAHSQGLIHRDLKPGNIMLTREGAKLLDFGLAKSETHTGGGSDLTASPTMSSPLTAEGTIVGTFQYMAPEQLEGRELDQRTDIFAFGAVLYEMATGHRAFEGQTQASLIASILKDEPRPISELQPMTPPALERVVRTCLAKNPDDRWQSMHDLALELQWIAEGGSQAGVPAPIAARRRSRERLAWGMAVVTTLVAIAAGIFAFESLSRFEPPRTIRFQISPPAGVRSVGSPKISPDARLLAFNAIGSDGNRMLWLRPLDALETRPMPGTEGASRPFWSPDSRFLGFFADGRLKKVDVSGGPPQTICEAPTGADGTWSADGLILFDGQLSDSLRVVAAGGGLPSGATTLDRSRGDVYHAWPHFLPDGRHFVYLAGVDSGDDAIRIGALGAPDYRSLGAGRHRVEYAQPGFLVFVRDRMLLAQPFDAEALETTGEPFPLVEGVDVGATGLADFSVSRSGVLAYQSGGSDLVRLVWVDRAGRELEEVGEPAEYWAPAVSPDGKRIAVEIGGPRAGSGDIWLLEPARDITSRFTFDAGQDRSAIWSPDGSRIAFSSDRDGQFNVYEKPATGAGEATPLLALDAVTVPGDWSPDGRFLSLITRGADWDILVLPMSVDEEPIPWLTTPFGEAQSSFSPDGRWIAYASNESGQWEIYVRPFPGPGGKWQISNRGGTEPQWRADGKELFYLAPDRTLMAVELSTGTGFEARSPAPLFEADVRTDAATRNRYVAAADGQRFLLLTPLTQESLAPTTVVVNWTAELQGR